MCAPRADTRRANTSPKDISNHQNAIILFVIVLHNDPLSVVMKSRPATGPICWSLKLQVGGVHGQRPPPRIVEQIPAELPPHFTKPGSKLLLEELVSCNVVDNRWLYSCLAECRQRTVVQRVGHAIAPVIVWIGPAMAGWCHCEAPLPRLRSTGQQTPHFGKSPTRPAGQTGFQMGLFRLGQQNTLPSFPAKPCRNPLALPGLRRRQPSRCLCSGNFRPGRVRAKKRRRRRRGSGHNTIRAKMVLFMAPIIPESRRLGRGVVGLEPQHI